MRKLPSKGQDNSGRVGEANAIGRGRRRSLQQRGRGGAAGHTSRVSGASWRYRTVFILDSVIRLFGKLAEMKVNKEVDHEWPKKRVATASISALGRKGISFQR